MNTIVLATNNQGKVNEFNSLFKPYDIDVRSLAEFSSKEVEEKGKTFIENALIKARHGTKITGKPTIADDSGLCVDALNGAPGIFSARFGGEPKNDALNNHKLLAKLNGLSTEKRTAYFYCVLVFLRHSDDPNPLIGIGKWNGIILSEPSGTNGFGYDPLFYIPELSCSAAELTSEKKNQYSHRAKALSKLLPQLIDVYKHNGI